MITGASTGLGEATARLLSHEGAKVVLGARRANRIQSLAKELTAAGVPLNSAESEMGERK